MPAAPYLPVYCGNCRTARLQPAQPGEAASCLTCGTPTEVLPGETYCEADVALFERIEPEVRTAVLSRRAAEHIVAELRDVAVRAESPESVLLRILDFLPGLHFLIPALDLQPTVAMERALLVRATGMLKTVVAARLRGM